MNIHKRIKIFQKLASEFEDLSLKKLKKNPPLNLDDPQDAANVLLSSIRSEVKDLRSSLNKKPFSSEDLDLLLRLDILMGLPPEGDASFVVNNLISRANNINNIYVSEVKDKALYEVFIDVRERLLELVNDLKNKYDIKNLRHIEPLKHRDFSFIRKEPKKYTGFPSIDQEDQKNVSDFIVRHNLGEPIEIDGVLGPKTRLAIKLIKSYPDLNQVENAKTWSDKELFDWLKSDFARKTKFTF